MRIKKIILRYLKILNSHYAHWYSRYISYLHRIKIFKKSYLKHTLTSSMSSLPCIQNMNICANEYIKYPIVENANTFTPSIY